MGSGGMRDSVDLEDLSGDLHKKMDRSHSSSWGEDWLSRRELNFKCAGGSFGDDILEVLTDGLRR